MTAAIMCLYVSVWLSVCVVYLFCEFDKFWFAESPADIMQFNIVKDKFVEQLSAELRKQDTRLTLDDFTAASASS